MLPTTICTTVYEQRPGRRVQVSWVVVSLMPFSGTAQAHHVSRQTERTRCCGNPASDGPHASSGGHQQRHRRAATYITAERAADDRRQDPSVQSMHKQARGRSYSPPSWRICSTGSAWRPWPWRMSRHRSQTCGTTARYGTDCCYVYDLLEEQCNEWASNSGPTRLSSSSSATILRSQHIGNKALMWTLICATQRRALIARTYHYRLRRLLTECDQADGRDRPHALENDLRRPAGGAIGH